MRDLLLILLLILAAGTLAACAPEPTPLLAAFDGVGGALSAPDYAPVDTLRAVAGRGPTLE